MNILKKGSLSGIAATVPIVIGYFPYGIAFGVLAQQMGLSLEQTILMSAIVYAGASQILALGLLQEGQPLISIVVATFFFNLRFLLMSASLAPHVSEWSFWKRTLFGYQVADEPFALLSSAFAKRKPTAEYALAVHFTAYLAWPTLSAIGFMASDYVPDVRTWGLDYTLPAVFIGLLLFLIRDRLEILIAIFSAALAICINLYGPRRSSIIITAIIGALLGVIIESWRTYSPSRS